MSTHSISVLMLLVGGALLLFSPLVSMPVSPDLPVIETPQDRLQTLVEPITAAEFTSEDSAAVSEFCLVFADILSDDTEAKRIVDTGDLRDRLQLSSALMFQGTELDARHPGLAGQINDILATWMEVKQDDGDVEVVDLDGEGNRRGCAIEAFRAIAWAVGG